MKIVDSVKFAELINQRQWYEKPGSTDRFSDGSSPCSLKVPALEERAAADCLHISDVLNARVRKVPFNPPAGDLRRKDLAGQWMKKTLQMQDVDNRKAAVLVQQKKEVNLAKQSVAGLKNLNLSYDVTELSIILRLGFQFTDKRTGEEAKRPEVQKALSVLDAALRFDARKIAAGLGLVVERPKTYGYQTDAKNKAR